MTKEERDRLDAIKVEFQRVRAVPIPNPMLDDFEFVLNLLDREQGVADLEARIMKTKKLHHVQKRMTDEIGTLRHENSQLVHAVRLLLTGFRLLYWQAAGWRHKWAGLGYKCNNCGAEFMVGKEWHSFDSPKCPLCVATNAKDLFNKWRLTYDRKNQFSEL